MVCDRCNECRDNGENYCKYCGECLSNTVIECCMCAECRRKGMTYCSNCGRKLPERKNSFKEAIEILGLATTATLSCVLILELITMFWGIPNVLPFLSNYESALILVIPDVVNILTLSGLPLQIYYILLVLAISVSAFLAFRKAYRPTLALLNRDTESIKNTALFEICVLFAALYFIEIVIVLIVQPTDKISFDSKWEEMFQLLEAPVWEEIITRILYLGLPVLIIYAITKRKELPFWNYLLGGWNKFDRTTLIFILFSAIMFGLGHVFGSWGSWKFIPTFLFGLIAGYLFVKYGVYATMLMHFLTDYISFESYLFGGNMVITAFVLIGVSFICIPYVWIYTKRGALCVKSAFIGTSK